MKILLISNGYPPRRWAGTETYTSGIVEELQRRGHQVQVLCTGDWDTGPHHWNGYTDETHSNVPVRRINLNWTMAPDPAGYLYHNPVIADYLASYLREIQPDLVHVTSCETLSASVLRVVKEAELPLVLSLTDFWFLCPRMSLLRSDGAICNGLTTAWDCLRCQLLNSRAYQWPSRILPEKVVSPLLMTISKYPALTRQRGLRGMAGNMVARKEFLRQAIRWPDYRITASRFVHNMFVANGVTETIKIQPYGHDLSWRDGYNGKTAANVLRIGFIGQIIPTKGVHLLLQAVQLLTSYVGDKFQLLIYGDLDKIPEYGAKLRALAADMPQVRFCGTYSYAQSAAVFAGMDILAVPSLWYDFPLVIYQAFATKTPVIVTNLGGMAEAVKHEVNGLLFERGDEVDLAGQLRRLVEEPGLLERLQAGVPLVKTIGEEVTELESIYRQL